MLVLSRKPEECIVVGDNIKITIVAIRPGRVTLGINAPLEVPIMRSELKAYGAESEFSDPVTEKPHPR